MKRIFKCGALLLVVFLLLNQITVTFAQTQLSEEEQNKKEDKSNIEQSEEQKTQNQDENLENSNQEETVEQEDIKEESTDEDEK